MRVRALAVLAGAGLACLGATTSATLASWSDAEFVSAERAGDGQPAFATSRFGIEQSIVAPFTSSFVSTTDENGQAMQFSMDGLSFTPGDVMYAPVAVRTVDGSDPGDLTLLAPRNAAATSADPGGLLWNALDVRVVAAPSTTTPCDATAFGSGAAIVMDQDLSSSASSPTVQPLGGDSSTTQLYCFEVTLPTAPTLPNGVTRDALQGRSVDPVWQFSAVSTG